MPLNENQSRNCFFLNHKEPLSDSIFGRRGQVEWSGEGEGFSPIRIPLQHIINRKISYINEGLKYLVTSARELTLKKAGNQTTRIDFFGNSYYIRMAIIKLRNSKQTEKHAYTGLLAYANHFFSIYPGLAETAIPVFGDG